MLRTEPFSSGAVMQSAFADATPTAKPGIYLVTRSKTGLRLWFEDNTLTGRHFIWSVTKDTLTIEEAPRGNKVVDRTKSGELTNTLLAGTNLRLVVNISPTWTAGKLVYEIPGIPDLNPKVFVPKRLSPVEQRPIPTEEMKYILTRVRKIEANSSYRISHDSKSGLAIFLARIEP